jgi:hypothetical protein
LHNLMMNIVFSPDFFPIVINDYYEVDNV